MSTLLHIVAGPDKEKHFSPNVGEPFLIGRGRQTNTCIEDLQVSRIRCQVKRKDGKILLTHLNSRSGTKVNDQPITQHILKDGDTIAVATMINGFRWEMLSLPRLLTAVPRMSRMPEK